MAVPEAEIFTSSFACSLSGALLSFSCFMSASFDARFFDALRAHHRKCRWSLPPGLGEKNPQGCDKFSFEGKGNT
jgi:hypothetical protein